MLCYSLELTKRGNTALHASKCTRFATRRSCSTVEKVWPKPVTCSLLSGAWLSNALQVCVRQKCIVEEVLNRAQLNGYLVTMIRLLVGHSICDTLTINFLDQKLQSQIPCTDTACHTQSLSYVKVCHTIYTHACTHAHTHLGHLPPIWERWQHLCQFPLLTVQDSVHLFVFIL